MGRKTAKVKVDAWRNSVFEEIAWKLRGTRNSFAHERNNPWQTVVQVCLTRLGTNRVVETGESQSIPGTRAGGVGGVELMVAVTDALGRCFTVQVLRATKTGVPE